MIENPKSYHAPMHTAEHVLNQTMVRKFGCERSFSNHIERKKSKCDYHFQRNLTPEEIIEINNQVNSILRSNLEVREEIIALSDFEKLYPNIKSPEKAEDKVRIIHIGNYDICPCSGEHVANTAEVEQFEITTTTFEEGVLRIRYKLKK